MLRCCFVGALLILSQEYNQLKCFHKESRKKKSSSTSGRATKALPPPPLELNGHRNLVTKFLNLAVLHNSSSRGGGGAAFTEVSKFVNDVILFQLM